MDRTHFRCDCTYFSDEWKPARFPEDFMFQLNEEESGKREVPFWHLYYRRFREEISGEWAVVKRIAFISDF